MPVNGANFMSGDDLRRTPKTYSISEIQVIYSAQLKARYREIQELREQVREAEIAALISRTRWSVPASDDQLH